jgi:hypothetical protein
MHQPSRAVGMPISATKSAINRHGPPLFDHVVSATNGPLNSDEGVFALHASADLPKLHSAPLGFAINCQIDVSRWRGDEPFDALQFRGF